MIRKPFTRHKSGQNQSIPPIKTSMSVKVSNCSRIVVSLRDLLDASTHLYKRLCPLVGQSVCPSVGRSIRPSVGRSIPPSVTRIFFFMENNFKWPEMIRKLFTRHKSGQNQSTLPIKTSMSVKVSNCSRIVVPLRDLFISNIFFSPASAC